MSDEELIELLANRRWTQQMKEQLVEAWNARRSDVGRINMSAVRTPCRLRQIRDSMIKWVEKEKNRIFVESS